MEIEEQMDNLREDIKTESKKNSREHQMIIDTIENRYSDLDNKTAKLAEKVDFLYKTTGIKTKDRKNNVEY